MCSGVMVGKYLKAPARQPELMDRLQVKTFLPAAGAAFSVVLANSV